jgi:hypothetical protein
MIVIEMISMKFKLKRIEHGKIGKMTMRKGLEIKWVNENMYL